MADDTSMPDYQEDPSLNNPLWHDEYMDLRELDNFQGMEMTYLELQMASTSLGDTPQGVVVANEMAEMYPQYIQAYNYHYRPDEFRPELIPPALRRQSATPPEAFAPAPSSQRATAAALLPGQLSVPATDRRSRAVREPRRDSRRAAGSSSSSSSHQGHGNSQGSEPKKRRKQ